MTSKAVRGTTILCLCVIGVTAAQFVVTYLPALQAGRVRFRRRNIRGTVF